MVGAVADASLRRNDMQLSSRRGIALAVALGLATQAGVAFGADLFAPLNGLQRTAGADAVLNALTADPATEWMDLVNVDARSVSVDAQSIELNFGPGMVFPASRTSSYVVEDGSVVWVGQIQNYLIDPNEDRGLANAGEKGEEIADPMNQIVMVRNGNKVTANARIGGQWFAIRPLSDDRHAILAIDDSKMPPDHPEKAYQKIFDEAAAAPKEVSLNKAITNIRVLVNYTQSAAAASGDINGLINLAVAESNTGYSNSGVEITLTLAGKAQVTYTESGSFSTDLARYRSTNDGVIDQIHTQRNNLTADLAILLINNSSSCGLASAIGASASTAFAAAHYGCATGYYSFAHELGHLQSARHDPANDPTTTPYAYGHGFQYPAGGWRTIMAYNCSSTNCTRLNYWSNPGKTFNGKAMGTTGSNDNHRVLNNTKATVAAFR
jgi:peptidyl-Asp metalloendopeptidase